MLPAKIGRFAIAGKLGEGGMGVVLLATDPVLGRRVAIKVLRSTSDPAAGQRLLREAQAVARLSHDNVIVVHEVGTHDDQIYFAMEHVTGGALRAWQAGRPWPEILRAYLQAGRGLEAAHAAGIVHRDFKPDNVLVAADGRIRVTDFGLAATPEGVPTPTDGDVALTQTGAVMGTPRYMAPEQHLGEVVDARADQFAFCVALFEALYGRPPFAGETHAAVREAVLAGARVPVPADAPVPAGVRDAVLRGLSRERAARFPAMGDLLAALAPPPPPRRRWPIVVAGLAALAIGAGSYVALTRGSAGPAHGTRVVYALDPIDPTPDPRLADRAAEIVRARIARRGVTSFRVAARGGELVVELPVMDREPLRETREMIARSARLEFHIVDDGTPLMTRLGEQVARDPGAAAAGISTDIDTWALGDQTHHDVYLTAHDGAQSGRVVLEQYLAKLAAADPAFAIPPDHLIAYEHDRTGRWRTYDVLRASAMTSASVQSARVSRSPADDRVVITVELDAGGAAALARVTTANVGKKVAFLLEDEVENAHVVTAPLVGGRVAITFERARVKTGDAARDRQLDERDADDLAIALEAGAMPAALRETSTREF